MRAAIFEFYLADLLAVYFCTNSSFRGSKLSPATWCKQQITIFTLLNLLTIFVQTANEIYFAGTSSKPRKITVRDSVRAANNVFYLAGPSRRLISHKPIFQRFQTTTCHLVQTANNDFYFAEPSHHFCANCK